MKNRLLRYQKGDHELMPLSRKAPKVIKNHKSTLCHFIYPYILKKCETLVFAEPACLMAPESPIFSVIRQFFRNQQKHSNVSPLLACPCISCAYFIHFSLLTTTVVYPVVSVGYLEDNVRSYDPSLCTLPVFSHNNLL